MKFSRNLISTFIDISHIDNDTLYKTLNNIGLEVESMANISVPRGVVIGKVTSKIKHPNADKLNVCKVDIGGKELQIVCGAKNVEKDQFVPVALIGTKLEKLTIKKAILREVESCGMICSSVEIGLPTIEDGILVLDFSMGDLVLGKELCEYGLFNDTIFEVGVTPNRGDYFSVLGIARDLAVVFDLKLKTFTEMSNNHNVTPGIGRILNVSFENNLQSSLYYNAVNLKFLTNPLTLRLAMAMCDNLCEDLLHNIMRFATYMTGILINGYKFDSYNIDDDVKISLHIKKDDRGVESVYADDKKLSDIGIFVNDKYIANTHSKLVIFEASFIPANHVSQIIFDNKMQVSENIAYFSKRGSSPLLEDGMAFLCYLLTKSSQSVIYSSSQQVIQNYPLKRIDFTFNDINNIIGNPIKNEEITDILKKMGFVINATADNSFISVNPPLYRQDINTIQDVAEEILRIRSIDSVVSFPQRFAQYKNIDKNYEIYKYKRSLAKKAIANRFFECVHYLFCKKAVLESYGYPTLPQNLDLSNPITSDLDTIRSSLLPSLIDSVIRNKNYGYNSIRLFEIGSVYNSAREESCNIAFIVSGNKHNPRFPYAKGVSWDFYDFASIISDIIGDFSLSKYQANVLYHPNICAKVIKNGANIGVIGKINPYFATKLEIDDSSFICELSFDALYKISKIGQFMEFSKYQASQRDITILIDKNQSFDEIKRSILEAKFKYLVDIFPLDIYNNAYFGDKISLSFRVVFQSQDSTLTLEDLKIDNIVALLHDKYGAELR